MSEVKRLTRAELETLLAQPIYWLCTKCGWHGDSKEAHPRACGYYAIEAGWRERKFAHEIITLFDQLDSLAKALEYYSCACASWHTCVRCAALAEYAKRKQEREVK